MNELDRLISCLPKPPRYEYDWAGLYDTPIAPLLDGMAQTPQRPDWHGEGDVMAHTRLVCEALTAMDGFRSLPDSKARALSLAALLHDIGKITCTRVIDGRLASPKHGPAGAKRARAVLWRDFGLCGRSPEQRFRETVCMLIKYHTKPARMIYAPNPELNAAMLASGGELAPEFTLHMLCMLAEADVLGREAADNDELLQRVRLGAVLAAEAGCLDGPLRFPSSHAKRACFSGRNVPLGQDLYDDAWGEVLLMCGLPGTGKDAWISVNRPDLPVVCLDDIRRAMRVRPEDDQGAVVREAKERARAHLRAKRPFIWNATCITPLTREKLIRLFEEYGACARVVYLETGWEEELRRNAARANPVPESVISRMLSELSPPESREARHVDWLCV